MNATTDLEVIEHDDSLDRAPATLFRSDDPDLVLERAAATADALARVVRDPKRKLISTISGREFPLVECWTLLGTLVGVFPVCVWSRPITVGEESGWEARVEAQTRDGAIVGAAEAMCTRAERNWKSRDEYALRSMAQTRATSKALRLPLGFVMTLAGLEATPAEEMPPEAAQERTGATEKPRDDLSAPAPAEELAAYLDAVEAAGFDRTAAANALVKDSAGQPVLLAVLIRHRRELEAAIAKLAEATA